MSTTTSSLEASEKIIKVSQQLSDIINGEATSVVVTDSGDIPSVRKALADSMLIKDPLPWQEGVNELDPLQPRTFTDGIIYWAPTATSLTPVPMGVTPIGDSNWKIAPINVDNLEGKVVNTLVDNQGEWDNTKEVKKGQIWSYQGSEWRSLTGADVEPVDGDDWRNLSKQGTNAWEEGGTAAPFERYTYQPENGLSYEVYCKTPTVMGAAPDVDFIPSSDNNSLNLKYYLKADGSDDAENLLNAITIANAHNLPVIGEAGTTIKLIEPIDIEVKTSIDWNGATIDVSEWQGSFLIRRKKDKISYAAGHPVVDLINSGADIAPAKSAIPAWAGLTELNDSFVLITTDIDQYQYRGEYQKWREFNTVTNFGVLTSPLKYGLIAGSVVSVQVWPMEDSWSYFRNVTFDLKDFDFSRIQFIDVETSYFNMSNVKFKDNQGVRQNSNHLSINFNNCAEIIVDGLYFQSTGVTTSSSGYNYLFNFNNSYNGLFKNCRGTGDGWGSTANYDPHRVTYDNCQISRIDFHRPVREYCRIQNCDIGQWGITASTLGDIIIRDTNFYVDGEYPNVNSTGIIRAREDTSGVCDGELLIERSNVFLNRNRFMLSSAESIDLPHPTESPVKPVTFNKITYRDVTAHRFRLDLNVNQSGTLLGDAKIAYTCPLIVMDNCKNVSFRQDLTTAKPFDGPVSLKTEAQGDYLNRVNFRVICDKVAFRGDNEFSRLEIKDDSIGRFNVDLVVSNSHLDETEAVYRGGLTAFIGFTGRASFNNSTVGGIDFTSTQPHKNYTSIDGGKIRKGSIFATGIFDGTKTANNAVSITGAQVSGNAETANDVLSCRISNIMWSIRNFATQVDSYVIGDMSTGTMTLPANINTNNTYSQRIVYNGINYRLPLVIPANDNSRSIIDLTHLVGSAAFARYERSGDTLSIAVTIGPIDKSNFREIVSV